MKIAVAGLGLIGGSVAKAFMEAGEEVFGCDRDEVTMARARLENAVTDELTKENIGSCEFVFIALYPEATIGFMEEYSPFISNGATVIDCGGTKREICKKGFSLAKKYGYCFMGGHPMAGRECGGYESSITDLYKGTNYILVTNDENKKENIYLLEKIIYHIGCGKITYSTPEEHDMMIGYTSQLMHVVAAALCDNEILDRAERFSAGSLRDCTRVAKLNPDMWTELFLENKMALTEQIEIFQKSLNEIGELIKNSDKEGTREFLKRSSDRKIRYLKEKARKRG